MVRRDPGPGPGNVFRRGFVRVAHDDHGAELLQRVEEHDSFHGPGPAQGRVLLPPHPGVFKVLRRPVHGRVEHAERDGVIFGKIYPLIRAVRRVLREIGGKAFLQRTNRSHTSIPPLYRVMESRPETAFPGRRPGCLPAASGECWGQKAISGAFRTACSHAPPTFRTPVEITLHSVLHVGRVKKPFSHRQADLPWKKAFYPDIIILTCGEDNINSAPVQYGI